MIRKRQSAYGRLTVLFSLSAVKWDSGIVSEWTILDRPKIVGTRHRRCPRAPGSDALPARRTSPRPRVRGRCRRAGALMIAHASAPRFASNHDLLLTVGNTHTHTHQAFFINNHRHVCWIIVSLNVLVPVEGVGEDSVEDKPYCDVSMEEVIPAVKTLIRAVRWVEVVQYKNCTHIEITL